MLEGELGRIANVAASAQDISPAGLPKYLQDAASMPTTLPPKGACEAYSPRISSLEYLSSSLVASTASTIFCHIVLSLSLDIRMTCIEMVLPPLTTWPLLILAAADLAMDTGLIPGCQRNHLSSNSIRAFTYFSGRESPGGNLHCPSSAILAPRSSPFLSMTTADQPSPLKRSRGRQNK